MRVRNHREEDNREINANSARIHLSKDKTSNRRKFNTSMEKKIEHIWFDSKKIGWSYNDFVVHVLEVLVVLQQRNMAKLTIASKQSSNTEMAA
jgi:hypothetical protein